MPLRVKSAESLPPFTFSPGPPSPRPVENDPPPPRPPADFIPERDMNMFGTMPLAGQSELGRGLVKCTRCGKPSMEWAAAEHKRICSHVLDGTPLTVKKGTKTTESKKRRASEAVSSESASPTKKRLKLPGSSVAGDDDGDAPVSLKGLKKSQVKKLEKEQQRLEKKAQKEQEKKAVAERKRLRASNPLDLDRQCGVINDKGLPCSRSLTCKTHTVGAKRGVEGRSRPYDDLHLEWQRANNPNFREPPSKKEKEIRKAERARDRVVQKKKKVEWDEDDSETEEGLRELGDLIHIARMAGDRVSGHGGGGKGGGVGGGGGGYGSAIKGAWWGISGIGMGGVGRMGGVWRAATYEFAQVGEMFTKALASRKQAMPDVAEVREAPRSGRAAPPPRIAINPASVHPTPQTVKHEQAQGAGGDVGGTNASGGAARSGAGNQGGQGGGGKKDKSNQGQNQDHNSGDAQSAQIPGVPANMTAMLSNMSKANRAAAAAAAAAAVANGGNAGNAGNGVPMANASSNGPTANNNNAGGGGNGGNTGFAPGNMNPNTMQALQAMAANFPGGINAMSNIQGLQNIPAVQAMQAMQAMQGAQGMQNMQSMQGMPGMPGMQGMQGMGGLPGMQGMQGMQGMPNMGNMGNMASMANMQQAAAAAAAMQQGGFQGMNFQGGGPGNGINMAMPNTMGQRMGGMPAMGQMGQMGQMAQMGQMGQMGQGQGMPEMLGQQGGGGGGQGQQQYQVSA